ncbi:MAG: sulfoxide reductase heme-binding subunit YedZ [Calditrichaeota bacterium]|nr:MAG: sulfoxide reductase heme-binding subunit YedZ [Calditrichota bacterium]MBL1207746.1 sulfoxide reductase heme-binding subunit YedZ [Calditrichota bacterium]NOG47580.1 sulfoxide reductase heme-binding subunit YedZ [Calditrichota bacterium]
MIKKIKPVLVFFCLLPILYLIYAAFTDNLGANPIEELLRQTGFWTLIFLVATLSISPIRKFSGWNKIIQFRRMIGLFTFFYAFLHFGVYLGLDRFFEWPEIVEDISKRPFITIGFSAFILLIPLAITSTKGWIRRLGKKWKKLHYLVYLVAVLGVVHFWWLVKKDITEPMIFAIIFTALFGIRTIKSQKRK